MRIGSDSFFSSSGSAQCCTPHPIAMLVEQAGGQATDAVDPILDIAATELHQRVPLIFGSAAEVRRIGRYHTMSSEMPDRAPLFAKRTLFQA